MTNARYYVIYRAEDAINGEKEIEQALEEGYDIDHMLRNLEESGAVYSYREEENEERVDGRSMLYETFLTDEHFELYAPRK